MGHFIALLTAPVIILALAVLAGLVVLVSLAVFRRIVSRRARQFGYPTTSAYLAAAPRSDAEKRDAVDLTMKGAVLCVIGIVLPPVLLIGLVPLFYGGRKLAYSQMGLGLADDPEQPEA